ncbi:MAG: ATP-binding protein [Candidatus Nanopelagicales bacterium]|nr:ATP-binding protein [Candidatus Nanopelagicales bacterium]
MIGREILDVALRNMRSDPVILLEGPRSVGKSTLLREIASRTSGRILDLDDLATRDAVASDPATLISRPGPILIDEYQKAPVVLDAIKAELNRGSRAGSFVLTGSARHDQLPAAAQALTGRLTTLTLYPLSQAEIGAVRPTFVAQLLQGEAEDVVARSNQATEATARSDYIARVVTGGFPLAVAAPSAHDRNRWIDSYVRLTLERDVTDLRRLRRGQFLRPVLDRVAGQTGQLLNVHSVSKALGLDYGTTDNYVRLLERVFLVFRLEPWGKTLSARTGRTPKVHMMDSGVAARLLRLTPDKLAALDPTALTEFGHLFESFIVGELLRQAECVDPVAGVGQWRTLDGDEVDFVLERDDGRVVGVEAKASARVSGQNLGPLRKFKSAVGKRFLAGVALYLGERAYTYEPGLHIVPADRVWR